jgi:hypothetical protein
LVDGKVVQVVCGKSLPKDQVGSTLFMQKHPLGDDRPTTTSGILKEWLFLVEEIAAYRKDTNFLDHFVFCIYTTPMKVQDKPENLRDELDFPSSTIVRKSLETFVEQMFQDTCVSLYERYMFSLSQKHDLAEAGKTYVNTPVVKLRDNHSWIIWKASEDGVKTSVNNKARRTTATIDVKRNQVFKAEQLFGRMIPVFMGLYNTEGYIVHVNSDVDDDHDDMFVDVIDPALKETIADARKEVSNRLQAAGLRVRQR